MQDPSIADLKGTVEAMDQRLRKLELEVFGEVSRPVPAPPPVVPTPVPTPQAPPETVPPPAPVPGPVDADEDHEAGSEPVPPRPPINVAKLLNFGGVAFLVVGAALLLMYSWQYFGAWFKIGAGLAAAGGLIALGERLSRRTTNQWYGQGVLSGGWSLAYFVVYAMQNIASVKVIDSVVLDSTLLVLLAAGCMAHAVYKRSQLMAILSTLLAFLTISLSTVTGFSVVAFAVLVVGVAAVTVRMRWEGALAASVVGSYVTYALFTQPQIAASVSNPAEGLWLSGTFLAVFWLAHNITAFFLGENDERPGIPSGMLVLNAVAFVGLGLHALGDAGMESARFLFLFLTGVVYLFATPFFSRRGQTLPILTTLIGLVCTTAALPLKLNPENTTAVWLLESALLVWAGLRFNLISFRWFATALSALLTVDVIFQLLAPHTAVQVFGLALDWRVILGCIGAGCFGLSSYLYSRPEFSGVLRKYEATCWHQLYFLASAAVLWWLPAATASATTLPCYWLAEGALLLLISRKSTDAVKHITTGVFFASALYGVLAAYTSLSPWFALGAIFWTAMAGLTYRFDDARKLDHGVALNVHRAYLLSSMVASLAYTSMYLGFENASATLAAEVAAFVAAGLFLRDRVLSASALTATLVVAGSTAYNYTAWTWANVLPTVVLGYAASVVAGRIARLGGLAGSSFTGDKWTVKTDEATILRSVFGVAASALLAMIFATLLTGPWISVAWALEGVLLIAAAYAFGEEWYRYSGLTIFALLAAKVVFIDFAGASTLPRILSFIITGLAFLAGSYADAWFRKRLKSGGDSA